MKDRKVKPKSEEKPNPFDLRINRQKHKVLGRRVQKWEVGKPLRSRHVGIKKRKETLLPELRNLNKSGKGVVDQRAATTARKAKLYQNVPLNGQNQANLTHKGEELDDDKLNQPVRDEDDDDDFDLLRRGDYVEVAHFGGGESGVPLSSEDFLQQVKVDKQKKQLEKEDNIKLTDELDKNWIAVRNLIKHKGSKEDSSLNETEEYDILLNQLMFGGDDRKATVSKTVTSAADQTKTPSSNVLIMEYLRNILSTDDVDIILKQFDSLLSMEINRSNSTVVKKAFNLLRSKVMRRCTLKSIGILSFLMCFREFKSYAQMRVVGFLKTLRYDSMLEIGKRILICHILQFNFPNAFFPEIIMSLLNILTLVDPAYRSCFIPSFSYDKIASSKVLAWSEDMAANASHQLTLKTLFNGTVESSDHRKAIIFNALIQLIEKVHKKYLNLDAFSSIFTKISLILDNLQEKFPKPMTDRLFTLVENLNQSKPLTSLTFAKEAPPMVTMLAPRIGESRRRDDRKKMQRVVKREYKSAARELRKDGAFIRDVTLRDTIAKDEARKRKVKKLMSEIAQERAMFKKSR